MVGSAGLFLLKSILYRLFLSCTLERHRRGWSDGEIGAPDSTRWCCCCDCIHGLLLYIILSNGTESIVLLYLNDLR